MDEKEAFMREALGNRRLLGRPPSIVPFGDWNFYYIKDVLHWCANDDPKWVVDVPVGFVTDLATIPAAFWTFLPKTAEYSYPAVIHDYLYWFQPCNREEADNVLKITMEDLKVSELKVIAIFNAVRGLGGGAWESNREARERGEGRVLKLFPNDMITNWENWKRDSNVFADYAVPEWRIECKQHGARW